MSTGEETRRSFDHRSRESLIEEIMSLRWQRTTMRIELEDLARVLEARAEHCRTLAERLNKSAKEWGKV